MGVGLEDEVAEEGAQAPAPVWESFPSSDRLSKA